MNNPEFYLFLSHYAQNRAFVKVKTAVYEYLHYVPRNKTMKEDCPQYHSYAIAAGKYLKNCGWKMFAKGVYAKS